jgi:predicted ATP-grasp superfamily ATP-dependent carboligase
LIPTALPDNAPDIFIAGASARAAAYSALRAGLRPWCADLFADADLRAICQVEKIAVDQYPSGVLAISERCPPGPWLYAGALENRPDIIQAISNKRPLWGCSPEAVQKARAPGALREIYDDAIPMRSPDVLWPGDRLPSFERWLIKPIAGAAGFGIREAYGAQPGKVPDGCYGQKYVPGTSCSGLFVGHERGCLFLGATIQLVGTPWLHAAPFHYAGSVGLLELPERVYRWFRDLDNILADRFGLRGIFGVDCILQTDMAWTIEINPRYTASVEVWEYARKRSALALHRRVFENPNDKETHLKLQKMRISTHSRKVVGKAILFARETVTIPEKTPWSAPVASEPPTLVGGGARQPPPTNVGGSPLNYAPKLGFDLPEFADLPSPGDRIEKGHPILTFFASDSSSEVCLEKLKRRAEMLDGWLYGESR